MNDSVSSVSQDGIERLRDSKSRFEKEERESGKSAGLQFASDGCEYAELKRLAEWHADLSEYSLDAVFSADDAYTVAEHVFFVIYPEQDGERGSSADFWGEFTDRVNSAFVQGFVDGLLEVYSEIVKRN